MEEELAGPHYPPRHWPITSVFHRCEASIQDRNLQRLDQVKAEGMSDFLSKKERRSVVDKRLQ
jgi:hypothetical protein